MTQTGARTWRGNSLGLDGLHCVLDTDGRLAAWSPELGAVTGYDEATLSSMDPMDLFDGESRDAVRAAVGHCLGTGEAEVTATLSVGGARSRRLDFRFVLVTDEAGRPDAVCVTARADPARPWSTVREQSDRLVDTVREETRHAAPMAVSD